MPLVLEYEEVLYKKELELMVSRQVVEDVINFHCATANRHKIHFLWRPVLSDPDDEMVLGLAVAANCSRIVTYNKSDFRGVERFGIRVAEPGTFLKEIGAV